MRLGALALSLLLLLAPRGAAAQQGSLFERLNLDRLQLNALGASVGAVQPSRVLRTELYSVHADYGEITPRWRVVFTATFWQSEYSEREVRAFADSLRRVVVDPSGDDTVRVGRVRVSDIAIATDLRWSPIPLSRFASPYVGGGISGHVVNTEGPAINGTFVEQALDYITIGVAGFFGLNLHVLPQLSVGVQGRYDLLSGVRFGSVRAGASYRFDRTPRP